MGTFDFIARAQKPFVPAPRRPQVQRKCTACAGGGESERPQAKLNLGQTESNGIAEALAKMLRRDHVQDST